MKNVCIVGFGKIAQNHVSALSATKSARLYAVCDIDPQRVKACQQTYGVVGYTDYEEVLKDRRIHAVHICTPHHLHYEMICQALAAGKRVVTEKPVTRTKEEFTRLLEIPEIGDVCVVLQNRLNSCVEALKALVDSGSLGSIKTAKAILTWKRTEAYYAEAAWRGRWETEGGGVLINQAVHILDLLTYLVGDVAAVRAVMANFSLEGAIEVEDTVTGYLKFQSGIHGLLFSSNAYGVSAPFDLELVFDRGKARYTDDALYVNGRLVATDQKATGEKAYWGVKHEKLIKNFYDEGSFFSVRNAENTMNTLFALYESAAQNGKEVEVSP